MIRTIKKRDGTLVEFDATKLNQWGEWAAGIGVEWGSVVLEAVRKCYDGCTTEDLHAALIATCVDRETEAHLKMAGRLYIGDVYKKAFGDWRKLPAVRDMYKGMVGRGLWAVMDYSLDELDLCNTFIDHSRDMNASLTESKQIMDKYAIKDRVDKTLFESPQFVLMRMALQNMERMPKGRRMQDVFELYTLLSTKKINAPTPFSINLGTPKKQYASCCVFTTNDDAASLAAGDHIAYMMTCASAGIGSHLKTRSKGDKVRQGAIVHQGKLPYYRMQESAVSANKQSSRGGANTMHYNCLDPELFDLMKLKNVQQVADMQVKGIDYSFGYNEEFARRVAKNEPWMLVSYGDAPELYEAMYCGDQEKFCELYAEVEFNEAIPKQIVKAREVAVNFLTEAFETGRTYEHNTGEMNRHTPFYDTIYSSNLCQEIALPTSGYESVAGLYVTYHPRQAEVGGEIGLCNLAAIPQNVSDEEYEKVAYYACLMIDNVIDLMEYPFPHLKYTAQSRRSIGVGATNLAYEMARKGLKYTTLEGKKHMHRLAERHSYWLHKAAIRLARERGVCAWAYKTKYSDGWLPIDTANKEIDKIIQEPLRFEWEPVRSEILELGGLRFSVLEAHMPCESSSAASGHTNALYPIRAGKVVKTSGTNKNLFIAPEWDRLSRQYELAWDIPWKDMTETYAIWQKFTGQSISADYYERYDSEKREVSSKRLLQDWLYRVKLGIKTRYYINSATGAEAVEEPQDDAANCVACKL
jgi:ribonucleoside-diphosphate reductase alpha subunit